MQMILIHFAETTTELYELMQHYLEVQNRWFEQNDLTIIRKSTTICYLGQMRLSHDLQLQGEIIKSVKN